MSEPSSLTPAPDPAPAGRSPGPPRWLLVALVLAALAALFWPRGERLSLAPQPEPVDGAGQRVVLAEHFAPVTLLHFWATWCPPCVTEIPVLRRLAADFRDEPGFALVFVAVRDDPARVPDFLGELAAENLYDPTWGVAKRWGTSQIPETYLLVNGKVIEKYEGATDWDRADLRILLRSAIADAR